MCASVGNYLKEHGWNEGEPVLSEAAVDPAEVRGPRRTQARARRNGRIAQGQRRRFRLLPAGRCARPPDCCGRGRWRRALARRLQQFLRHHPLQPQRALRHGGVRARRCREAASAGERCAAGGPGAAHRPPTRAPCGTPALTPGRRDGAARQARRERLPPRLDRSFRVARGGLERLLQRAARVCAPPSAAQVPPQSAPPTPPAHLQDVPDAIPRFEPRSIYGNPPFYEVFGKRYYVMASSVGYVERGVASWYGPGFHKELTSVRRAL